MFSLLLNKYLGVKLLNCTVSVFNFMRNCQAVFLYHSAHSLALFQIQIPVAPHPCQQPVWHCESCQFQPTYLVCSIPHYSFNLYSPDTKNDGKHFACAYWPFLCLLVRSDYSFANSVLGCLYLTMTVTEVCIFWILVFCSYVGIYSLEISVANPTMWRACLGTGLTHSEWRRRRMK